MPEVNPALFSWFRVYLALFLDILQKCCYPEPVAGAGQDWTGSTTLEGWWNVVKNGGKPTGAGAGEKKPELDENIPASQYYLGEMETGNRIRKYFGLFIWGPRWVRFES